MTALSTRPDPRVSYRSVLVLAAVVLVPGLAYGVAVLLPYLAGDFDTPSLGSGWLGLVGMFALFLAPLGALTALVGCAVQLLALFPRSDRRVPSGVATGLVVVAMICVVEVAWFLSPVGRSLTSWYLD
jgi:hypothetical protein